jgi:hypothetical protein
MGEVRALLSFADPAGAVLGMAPGAGQHGGDFEPDRSQYQAASFELLGCWARSGRRRKGASSRRPGRITGHPTLASLSRGQRAHRRKVSADQEPMWRWRCRAPLAKEVRSSSRNVPRAHGSSSRRGPRRCRAR